MDKKRILVVDDEKELVKAMQVRLESAGYEVFTAYDGEEALNIVKKKPDLILLDVMIPKLDGFGVSEHLKTHKETAFIPVVMLTAKSDTETMFKAEKFKVKDYIIKPFDSKELLDLIKRYF